MIRWIMSKWHARQRALDIEILWPACVQQTDSLTQARAAFYIHAFNDPAWLCLGESEIKRQVKELGL